MCAQPRREKPGGSDENGEMGVCEKDVASEVERIRNFGIRRTSKENAGPMAQ